MIQKYHYKSTGHVPPLQNRVDGLETLGKNLLGGSGNFDFGQGLCYVVSIFSGGSQRIFWENGKLHDHSI